jgi:hypothetical protein
MWYLFVKAAISGLLVAIVSEVAKRYPGLGGLIASLPVVSVLGMIWLWRDTHDPERIAAHALGTFWFVLPSLPLFLLMPVLLRHGAPFWLTLAASSFATMAVYALMLWLGPRLGLRL